MAKLKFHIHTPGDPSVGLFPIYSEVTVEDNMIWSEELIQEKKNFLAAFYDTEVENVLTGREMVQEKIKGEEDMIKYYESVEEDKVQSIESCKHRIEKFKKLLENPELL